ncbi:MAG: CoA-binding protein, partial [Bacillota bacterium]
MGIFAGEHTRLVVQGITGREGKFHASRMREYGTKVVAGVTPGRGGADVDGIPVFDTVAEAVDKTDANASCVFVPPGAAADAVAEALAAGLDLVVCITEGIPTLDVMSVLDMAKARGWRGRVIGPNCPGIVTCGKALMGITPGRIFKPGPVGLASRSGTLTYEVVNLLTSKGIGQSTCVGVGGDPIIGTNFVDCLAE